jgi:hypothetical protein
LCQESLFVKDVAVIDAAQQENCIWQVKTDENYILVFTLENGDGNFEQAQDFVDVSGTKKKCFPFSRSIENPFSFSRFTTD